MLTPDKRVMDRFIMPDGIWLGMPQGCTRDGCNGAVVIVDSNGVTDPEKDRWEQYECEFGHTFTVTLSGRPA